MSTWWLLPVVLGAWLWANLAGWIFVHLTGEVSGPFSWRLFLGPWYYLRKDAADG